VAGLVNDIRLAIRRLRASPGFALFAITSLAAGIGVTTAIYSAVRTLLWMPLGVPHQHELVQIVNGQNSFVAFSWPDFATLRHDQASFQNVAALTRIHTAISGAGEPRTVDGEAVSGEFFETLQVQPRLGRLIDPADEAAGAHVVVLSQAFWTNACAADPGIVGRTLRVGGDAFEVIGVVAGDFHGLDPSLLQYSVWIPLSAIANHAGALRAPSWTVLKTERSPTLAVWGRLRSGVTVAHAAAEVSVLGRQLEAAQPTSPMGGRAPRQWVVRQAGAAFPNGRFIDTIVTAILTAIATLLLIACTNLANLALARGTARAQEIAVRSALGADRWRLVREQLVEGGIVVVCGAALGLAILMRLVAYWTGDLPMAFGSTIAFTPQVDGSVLAAASGAMVIAVLVFGVWPALQSTRSDVREALGAGHAATSPKWRLHRTIIAWQVCGSVALLLVALLSAKILMSLEGGSESRHSDLALAQVDFTANGENESQMRQLALSILDEVRVQRGIRAVSAANGLPFGIYPGQDSVAVTTPDHASESEARGAWLRTPAIAVTSQFFSTAGIRLVHGRAFNGDDTAAAPRVAIVTEEFARAMFRATNVVGRVLAIRTTTPTMQGPPAAELGSVTIVGVSADDEPWGNGQRKALMFLPFGQRYQPFATITFLADAVDARAAVSTLRTTIRRVDPDLSISSAGTGAVLLGGFYVLRVIAMMSAALGALALVLAMAGLFGVLSHVVTKRTREMGIRLAIGAERGDIFRLIVRDGLQPVGKGLLLGLVIGIGSRIAVKAFVETKVAAVDPWPLLLLPIPFVLAALAACYFPAARASRVDPNVALRQL
jgi:putative ABC transport system permease protein